MDRLELRIHGMDCAEEVALLRHRLGDRSGVDELVFDITGAKLTIVHDPAVIAPQQIKDLISQAGMRAEVWSAEHEGPQSLLSRHSRSILTILSGCSVLLASVLDYSHSTGTFWSWLLGEGGHHDAPPAAIALRALAILFGFGPSVPKLAASLSAMRADISVLMGVSLTGALVLGEYSEGGMLAFLFSLSGMLENWSLRKAQSSVAALLDLTPAEATVLHHDHEHRIPVSRIPVGERVRIRPGERVPCDGVVESGESAVDQAIITGEAAAVLKRRGDPVFAGTLNGLGALEVRTTSAATDTALARIVRMVAGSQHRRAPSEQFVERFARVYTPAILILAVVVALLPPLVTGNGNAATWLYQGMVVLLIACPCALVVSTPVTVVSALSSAARRGVLVKGGAFLEEAARLRAIAFDKTGVLTQGQPCVQKFVPINGRPATEILGNLAGLELRSEHPLASALVAYAREQGIEPCTVDRFQARCGRGAEAEIGAQTFWAGNWRFCEEKDLGREEIVTHLESLEDASHTAVLCGTDREVWALIGLTDPIREGAREVVSQLQGMGVNRMVMLTGDNRVTAAGVAEALGIAEVHAELLPEQKLAFVEQMRQSDGWVAMVGDGVNDAQAMATASVGIALAGRSSDLALETADVVLSSGGLRELPFLLRHARRAVSVIRQNVWLAIGLKVAFLVMALSGNATLWMAIVADMGATLMVTFNGLRLLRPTK